MALRYLLDTNTVSYHVRRSSPALQRRLKKIRASSVALSVVTEMELRYGLERNPRLRIAPLVEAFLAGFAILPVDSAVAKQYAKVRAALDEAGTPIGPLDLIIAAHAMALKLTLITSNVGEFQRVQGLKCEDWT
jgi:tRNA(fMet)-specific endonuclease VapC